MAKRIKGALVIIFILVLSCLLLVGCNQVAKLDMADKVNESIALENDNNSPSMVGAVELGGSYSQMVEKWNQIISGALETGNEIKVRLMNDWIAEEFNADKKIFGEGVGFDEGRIFIPKGAKIVLDLNGKKVDRALNEKIKYGQLFLITGNMSIVDTTFNMTDIYNIYNQNTMDEKEELLEKYNGVECGRLTGGKNLHNLYGDIANSGGAIILNDSGVLNIYGGMFDNNQSNYGGFIATGENTTVNIYGGLFMNNQSTGDAGVGFIMGKCYLHDAVFLNNTAGNGGVFYFANNNV